MVPWLRYALLRCSNAELVEIYRSQKGKLYGPQSRSDTDRSTHLKHTRRLVSFTQSYASTITPPVHHGSNQTIGGYLYQRYRQRKLEPCLGTAPCLVCARCPPRGTGQSSLSSCNWLIRSSTLFACFLHQFNYCRTGIVLSSHGHRLSVGESLWRAGNISATVP